MKCIVTAGPTYEPLDKVRRLTNFSTGQLGTELANHLAGQGRVGDHRHVPAVLFEGCDGEDDRRGPRQGGDGRPGEVGEFHAAGPGGRMAGREQCTDPTGPGHGKGSDLCGR